MIGMEGVHWVKDDGGRLAQIRVDMLENPELGQEVYHLIQALSRAKEASRATIYRESWFQLYGHLAATPVSLSEAIREAKLGKTLTKNEFSQGIPSCPPNDR